MRCIKTGLYFIDDATGLAHVGDLKVSDNEFYITGVMRCKSEKSRSGKDVLATISSELTGGTTISVESWDFGDNWAQSHGPVTFLVISHELLDFFREWEPQIAKYLDELLSRKEES